MARRERRRQAQEEEAGQLAMRANGVYQQALLTARMFVILMTHLLSVDKVSCRTSFTAFHSEITALARHPVILLAKYP